MTQTTDETAAPSTVDPDAPKKTTKVYEYGALPPITNLPRVVDQMKLAHRYGNVLVEIELKRRTAVRAAQNNHLDVAPLHAAVLALEAELEALRDGLQKTRQKTRGAAPDETAVTKQSAKEIQAKLKTARLAWKDAKKANNADVDSRAWTRAERFAMRDLRVVVKHSSPRLRTRAQQSASPMKHSSPRLWTRVSPARTRALARRSTRRPCRRPHSSPRLWTRCRRSWAHRAYSSPRLSTRAVPPFARRPQRSTRKRTRSPTCTSGAPPGDSIGC